MAAAAALLSPAPAVRPLSGTTLSFGVPYKNKTRIRTMREKYHPYYPRAAVMCQLAASTLCKHTKDMVLQRVVMDMIPQGGLVRKSYPSNDVCCHKRGCLGVVLHVTISRKTSLLTIVLTRAMPRSGSDVKEDGKDGGIDFFEPPDPRILLVIDIMMVF
uniref:Uncharacterized protein n=1 Tax=Leersia perrieri TaxID=77586 RepID=A0A0D9XVR9_9ORYZ